LSTIQQLETRIQKLEAEQRRRQPSVAGHPPEIWMVRAQAKPGETWPVPGTTNIFDGILIEPLYTPGVDVGYTAEVLGDLTDATKGSWIQFWSKDDPGENAEFQVWHPNSRGDNWYAEPPPDLYYGNARFSISAAQTHTRYCQSYLGQHQYLERTGTDLRFTGSGYFPYWASIAGGDTLLQSIPKAAHAPCYMMLYTGSVYEHAGDYGFGRSLQWPAEAEYAGSISDIISLHGWFAANADDLVAFSWCPSLDTPSTFSAQVHVMIGPRMVAPIRHTS